MSAVRIGSEHCRAICDEVGERLRLYLDGSCAAPSQRIMALLRELERRELEAPSIVPSLEDTIASVSESVPYEFTQGSETGPVEANGCSPGAVGFGPIGPQRPFTSDYPAENALVTFK